jgi:ATP-dependent helicase HrpB
VARTDGDLLAFLPGVGEIERTRDRLTERLRDVPILPLHGQCEPPAQRAAIRRDPEGRRRIVLATSIAETSLTLDGVRVVVDSPRAARVRQGGGRDAADHHAGLQASAARRGAPRVRGRAWPIAVGRGRPCRSPAYDPPEILTSDLAPLALSLAHGGG